MLTREEQFLWQCARSWRQPQPERRLPTGNAAQDSLNWQHVVQLAADNRMGPLLKRVLDVTGDLSLLPGAAQRSIQRDVAVYTYRARLFARELQRFLNLAAGRNLPVVVLKGLWLSLKIYGQPNMRPGGDIDILLHQKDVTAALNVLDYEMDYGRWWRPILDDTYYARHHLHQQRCNDGRAVWFELHWRLDHPYTTLTVDYDAMVARSRPSQLLGEPVRELAPPDLLLSLVVHLAKHAVYLTSTIARRDLPRLILADGMLMYFVDVAEVLRLHAKEMDWNYVVEQTHSTGASSVMGAVLQVCSRNLDAPVPGHVLQALPVMAPDRPTGWLMHGMAHYLLDVYQGQRRRGLWPFLAGFRETIIFRPIRLLDLLHYCLPGAGYLQRRYGSASTAAAWRHLLRALSQYVRLGLDTVFYTWRRERRLRRLNPEELDRRDARYEPLLSDSGPLLDGSGDLFGPIASDSLDANGGRLS